MKPSPNSKSQPSDPWAIDDRKRTEFQYNRLEDVLKDPLFPQVDVLLRSGSHIDMDDIRRYEFLQIAEPYLEDFYSRYRCSLLQGPEGYYYLLSDGTMLGNRRLGTPEMLVGQVLALMYMDPAYLTTAGKVRLDQILVTLEMTLGQEKLTELIAPRRRGKGQDKDNEKIRDAVGRALRTLKQLGFVSIFNGVEFLPRKSIMRFADPVRDTSDIRSALERLVKSGKVLLSEEVDEGPGEEGEGDEE
jgi:chromosome partition protein MukE